MERLRFFDGQFLTAKDLQAEQDYHREKRQLHNRLLHGYGVVEGLTVSVDPGTGSGPQFVSVSPGLALDRKGREILVEGPVRVELATSPSDTCFVTLEYTETATDPVPVANGATEFSRISEGFLIQVATTSDQLCLARLIRADDRWVLDDTYCPPAL